MLACFVAETLSSTACELNIEAAPDDAYSLGNAGLRCDGDPITIYVSDAGGDDYSLFAKLAEQHPGTATLLPLSDYNVDDYTYFQIVIAGASDVTFTSIRLAGLAYYTSEAPLTLLNCLRCELHNVSVEGIQLLDMTAPVFRFSGCAGAAVRSATFSNLGLDGAAFGTVVVSEDSNLLLQDVRFTDMSLQGLPAVTVTGGTGGALTVERGTWQGVSGVGADASMLHVVAEGADVTLTDCVFQDLTLTDAPAVRVVGAAAFRAAGCAWQHIERFVTWTPNAVSAGRGAAALVVNGTTGGVHLTNCSFKGVTARGGAAVLQLARYGGRGGGGVELSGCRWQDVTADPDAALVSLHGPALEQEQEDLFGRVSIADCSFEGYHGSAVMLQGCGNTSGISSCDDVTGNSLQPKHVLSVHGTNFTGGVASYGAALRSDACPALAATLARCAFTNLTASGANSGGAVALAGGGCVVASNCSFADSRADQGGAVRLSGISAMAATDCVFESNRATGGGGGAIYAHGNSGIGGDGVEGARVELTRCRFFRNAAAYIGGALAAADVGAIILEECELVENVAGGGSKEGSGGAVHVSGAVLVARGSSFIANSATSDVAENAGGAFYAIKSALSLTSCRFEHNAAGQQGGAMYIISCANCPPYNSNASLTPNTTDLPATEAGDGLGPNRILGCAFANNTVRSADGLDGRGGAIASIGGGPFCSKACPVSAQLSKPVPTRLVIAGDPVSGMQTRFISNAAGSAGGAVYAEWTALLLQDAVLERNAAPVAPGIQLLGGFGGYPSAAPFPDTDAGTDWAEGAGGFFSFIDRSTFLGHRCSSSGAAGGALHVPSLPLSMQSFASRPWSLMVRGAAFVNNTCQYGGALSLSGQQLTEVRIVASEFEGNSAVVSGGAVQCGASSRTAATAAAAATPALRVLDSSFRRNDARETGGALEVQAGWGTWLSANDFTSNGNTDLKSGGAVNMGYCEAVSGGPAYLVDNNFSANLAKMGGAISTEDCNVDISGGGFYYNSAPSNAGRGGAVAVRNIEQNPISVLTINGSRLVGNSAAVAGGAVHALSQGLVVIDASLSNNTARVAGGAIYAQDAAPQVLRSSRGTGYVYSVLERQLLRVRLEGSTFDGNHAEDAGGAVRVQTSALSVDSCAFTNNSVGDDFISDSWSDSGGAINGLSCFGYADLFNSTFSGNAASGSGGALSFLSCDAQLSLCVLENNTAGGAGGAAAAYDRRNNTYSATPRLLIDRSSLYGNIAAGGDGGGVYTADMSLWIVASNLTGNTAPAGGGGAAAVSKNLETVVQESRFERNAAGGAAGGGALLASGAQYVDVADSTFAANAARLGDGGAAALVGCGCVVLSGGVLTGNRAHASGGGLRLQPAPSAAGSGGACIGRALPRIRSDMSTEGRRLLNLQYMPYTPYNVTVVYDAADGGMLVRGGRYVAVPQAAGPLWLLASLGLLAVAGGGGGVQDWDRTLIVASAASGLRLHVGAADAVAAGEVGRLCEVNFGRLPYGSGGGGGGGGVYNSSTLQAALGTFAPADWDNPAPRVAAALYGTDPAASARYNGTLLAPLAWSAPPLAAAAAGDIAVYDSLLPRSAAVFCLPVAAGDGSLAPGLSAVLMGLELSGNTAGQDGGGAIVDGGGGRVMLDGVTVLNNTAESGDGGGVSIAPSAYGEAGNAEVYVVSSSFEGNAALEGQGGALAIRTDAAVAAPVHRQAAVYNTSMDGNAALDGGAVSASAATSLMLSNATLRGNAALGSGGAVQATNCGELHLAASTLVEGNSAGEAGGGLAVSGCGAVVLLRSALAGNRAPSGGGAYLYNPYAANSAPAAAAGGAVTAAAAARVVRQRQRVGGMLVLAAECNVTGNRATAPDAGGLGGGLWLSGRVSAAWADGVLAGNRASGQGGAVLLDSTCNLTAAAAFLLDATPAPTAFPGLRALLPSAAAALRYPRPNGCWGTAILRPTFQDNTAGANGGTLFANFPQALSLGCSNPGFGDGGGDGGDGGSDGDGVASTGGSIEDVALGARVLEAMREESSQAVSALNVARCFDPRVAGVGEEERELRLRAVLDNITTVTRSSIEVGYGPFLGLVPSKLRLTAAEWSSSNIRNSTSGVSPTDTAAPPTDGTVSGSWPSPAPLAAARRLAADAPTAPPASSPTAVTAATEASAAATAEPTGSELLLRPVLQPYVLEVEDPATGARVAVPGYRLTTLSGKAMDLGVQLLDALGQVAIDGTLAARTPMALVRATLLPASAPGAPADASTAAAAAGDSGSSGTGGDGPSDCPAELLGSTAGLAYQGQATLASLRLRALKGDYLLQLTVSDTRFAGAVEPLNISVHVPPCATGQVPVDGGYVCQECGPLTFSLWQDTEPLVDCTYPPGDTASDTTAGDDTAAGAAAAAATCLPCPLNAECPGGAVLLPSQGAWHSAANSSNAILCPTAEACREGDDEAQAVLLGCQQWWYSRPVGFEYEAFAASILANDSTSFPEAPGALPDGGGYNLSDPSLCALWGLPPGHPADYMTKQCAEGYAGRLCGVCRPVDGVLYTSDGDFGCQPCRSRAASLALSVISFVANVASMAITALITFSADYMEEEVAAVGDFVKVLIVHFQFLIIVMHLNIDWPAPLLRLSSAFGTVTGSLSLVSSPGCWLGADASPEAQARLSVGYGLISPLALTLATVGCWVLRYCVWNGAAAPLPPREERGEGEGGGEGEEGGEGKGGQGGEEDGAIAEWPKQHQEEEAWAESAYDPQADLRRDHLYDHPRASSVRLESEPSVKMGPSGQPVSPQARPHPTPSAVSPCSTGLPCGGDCGSQERQEQQQQQQPPGGAQGRMEEQREQGRVGDEPTEQPRLALPPPPLSRLRLPSRLGAPPLQSTGSLSDSAAPAAPEEGDVSRPSAARRCRHPPAAAAASLPPDQQHKHQGIRRTASVGSKPPPKLPTAPSGKLSRLLTAAPHTSAGRAVGQGGGLHAAALDAPSLAREPHSVLPHSTLRRSLVRSRTGGNFPSSAP